MACVLRSETTVFKVCGFSVFIGTIRVIVRLLDQSQSVQATWIEVEQWFWCGFVASCQLADLEYYCI